MTAEARYPIAVVSRETGLGSDVIRAWERRYGAVVPRRSAGRRRLYTEAQIERLRLLKQAVDSGWQIGQIANLVDDDLRQLRSTSNLRPFPRQAPETDIEKHLRNCIAAVKGLDGPGLQQQLEQASVVLSRHQLLEELVASLMTQVGDGCASGSMRTANEHLATVVLRSFLDSLHGAYRSSDTAPAIVVATPVFQFHELGALLVATVARLEGWQTVYLGANLPAEEIAAAAQMRGARIVALSIAFPSDDSVLAADLLKLGRLVEPHVTLVAGGAATRGYVNELDAIGAATLDRLSEFRALLESHRSTAQSKP